jgi:thiol-disulfide isomerase/thioredoxin
MKANPSTMTEEDSSDLSTHSAVTDKVIMKDSLRKNLTQIHKVPLIPMNCSFGIVTKKPEQVQPLQTAVKNQCRQDSTDVAIVFAVRRPGCGFCREHGLQLTQLAKEEDLAMLAVVKGDSTLDENLLEFRRDYFRFPIVQDEKWLLYKFMGDKVLSVGNILKSFMGSAGKRHAKKNIVTRHNSEEDGKTAGGILILDKTGEIKYAYEELFGEELDIEAIRGAIHAIREGVEQS